MTHQQLIINKEHEHLYSGYLVSAKGGKGPGIVLIQEIFGVNKTMRAIADRFAALGYTVLVPDLFWRFQPNIELDYEGKDLEKAFDYYHRYDLQQGVVDLGQAITALRNQPACTGKVAVLGFCLGGKLTYLTAAHHPVDTAVVFYGGGIIDHLADAKNITCPVLMHFGETDEMIPADQIERIKIAFEGRKDVEIYVYPEAGHAFYNHDRSSYNLAAANLAQQRTINFLQHTL